MTSEQPGGVNRELFNSPADWISPNLGAPADNYLENPPSSRKHQANNSGRLHCHSAIASIAKRSCMVFGSWKTCS
jgi:hypothetical protein